MEMEVIEVSSDEEVTLPKSKRIKLCGKNRNKDEKPGPSPLPIPEEELFTVDLNTLSREQRIIVVAARIRTERQKFEEKKIERWRQACEKTKKKKAGYRGPNSTTTETLAVPVASTSNMTVIPKSEPNSETIETTTMPSYDSDVEIIERKENEIIVVDDDISSTYDSNEECTRMHQRIAESKIFDEKPGPSPLPIPKEELFTVDLNTLSREQRIRTERQKFEEKKIERWRQACEKTKTKKAGHRGPNSTRTETLAVPVASTSNMTVIPKSEPKSETMETTTMPTDSTSKIPVAILSDEEMPSYNRDVEIIEIEKNEIMVFDDDISLTYDSDEELLYRVFEEIMTDDHKQKGNVSNMVATPVNTPKLNSSDEELLDKVFIEMEGQHRNDDSKNSSDEELLNKVSNEIERQYPNVGSKKTFKNSSENKVCNKRQGQNSNVGSKKTGKNNCDNKFFNKMQGQHPNECISENKCTSRSHGKGFKEMQGHHSPHDKSKNTGKNSSNNKVFNRLQGQHPNECISENKCTSRSHGKGFKEMQGHHSPHDKSKNTGKNSSNNKVFNRLQGQHPNKSISENKCTNGSDGKVFKKVEGQNSSDNKVLNKMSGQHLNEGISENKCTNRSHGKVFKDMKHHHCPHDDSKSTGKNSSDKTVFNKIQGQHPNKAISENKYSNRSDGKVFNEIEGQNRNVSSKRTGNNSSDNTVFNKMPVQHPNEGISENKYTNRSDGKIFKEMEQHHCHCHCKNSSDKTVFNKMQGQNPNKAISENKCSNRSDGKVLNEMEVQHSNNDSKNTDIMDFDDIDDEVLNRVMDNFEKHSMAESKTVKDIPVKTPAQSRILRNHKLVIRELLDSVRDKVITDWFTDPRGNRCSSLNTCGIILRTEKLENNRISVDLDDSTGKIRGYMSIDSKKNQEKKLTQTLSKLGNRRQKYELDDNVFTRGSLLILKKARDHLETLEGLQIGRSLNIEGQFKQAKSGRRYINIYKYKPISYEEYLNWQEAVLQSRDN